MVIRGSTVAPLSFDGLEIRDYTAGMETRASLAVVRVPPGGRHHEAWSRRSDKYYYVLEGWPSFVLDGERYELQPGDCCLVRQGQHFRYENATRSAVALLLMHAPSFDLADEVFVDHDR